MMDYSVILKEEASTFILNYVVSEDGKYLLVDFANGETKKIENRFENQRKVLEKMKQQIEEAYTKVHDFSIDYTSMNIASYLKSYIVMKTKAKDIYKNKLLLKNLDLINQCLHSGKAWTLYLPLYLGDLLLREYKTLSLRDADKFSLKDIQTIVDGIERYSKVWFPVSNYKRPVQFIKS